MASALNSVTPTSYFDMSFLSLRASVSQLKRGDVKVDETTQGGGCPSLCKIHFLGCTLESFLGI